MLLRHLIVLIINARKTNPPLLQGKSAKRTRTNIFATSLQSRTKIPPQNSHGNPTPCGMGFDRSDQKTRIHVAILCLAGGNRLKQNRKQSLHNVKRSGRGTQKGAAQPNSCSLLSDTCAAKSPAYLAQPITPPPLALRVEPRVDQAAPVA